MAYSSSAMEARLAGLNETQDSITAVAQWIMFHKRQAADSARVWSAAVDAAEPRHSLALIYLANEIVQQARARRKQDFIDGWSPVVADTIGRAFSSVDKPTQDRILRVNRVWRDRQVFSEQQQLKIDIGLGLQTLPAPAELETLVNSWTARETASKNASLEALESALRTADASTHPLQRLEALNTLDVGPYEEFDAASREIESDLVRLQAVVKDDPRPRLLATLLRLRQEASESLQSALPTEKSPDVEPLSPEPSAEAGSATPMSVSETQETVAPPEPVTEVYTAQKAAQAYEDEDASEPDYAPESDVEEPAVKKPKLDLDPQLASFLESMAGNQQ